MKKETNRHSCMENKIIEIKNLWEGLNSRYDHKKESVNLKVNQ